MTSPAIHISPHSECPERGATLTASVGPVVTRATPLPRASHDPANPAGRSESREPHAETLMHDSSVIRDNAVYRR